MTPRLRRSDQRGLALALVLMTLVIVLLLALAGARNALLGEKASRNDRDRQQALHAAEAALLEAEADILQSVSGPRHDVIAGRETSVLSPGECGRGLDNPLLGLCRPAPVGASPAWQRAGFADPTPAAGSIPYGHFTGRIFPHAAGPLPVQPPRYIVEILEGAPGSAPARVPRPLYRITAIGFGARHETQAVLQSWFRAADRSTGGERTAWREITDWSSNEQTEY